MQFLSRRIGRRCLLQALAAPALLMIACDDDPTSFKSIPDATGSESFGERLWNVIKQHEFRGTVDQLEPWFTFLLAASQEPSPQPSPLNVIGGKEVQLTLDDLILIIENYQYRFVKLSPEAKVDEIVIAYSSRHPQSRVRINQATSFIAKYLPTINSMLGNFVSSYWLHVQLDFEGGQNSAALYNMWLTADSWKSRSTVAHELVHLYNYNRSLEFPTFVTEGLADVIAHQLTGDSVYARFATGRKVHLAYRTATDFADGLRPETFDEAGNGFLFFKELIKVLGMQRFIAGILSGYESAGSTGLDMLRSLKALAGDKRTIEDLYIRWIADYTPASS